MTYHVLSSTSGSCGDRDNSLSALWTLGPYDSGRLTWHASFPASPPAQKLLAGSMNIFSVTAFILRMHSASLTTGISASLIRKGIGPASPMYPYPVTVQRLPAAWLTPRAGRHTRHTPSLSSACPCSFSSAMSLSSVCELWLWWMYVVATRSVCAPGLPYFLVRSWSPTRT